MLDYLLYKQNMEGYQLNTLLITNGDNLEKCIERYSQIICYIENPEKN